MSQVLTQVALHRIISYGLDQLRNNINELDEIFEYYKYSELKDVYGQAYIDGIKQWFTTIQIPVVQSWTFNASNIPSISIHLANEREDETKASMGDYFGEGTDDSTIGGNAFLVELDIRIHSNKTGDEAIWLYAIVSYILFKYKLKAHNLGLKLITFAATDYKMEEAKYPADNIWTRNIRFKCVVENFWNKDKYTQIDDVDVGVEFESV